MIFLRQVVGERGRDHIHNGNSHQQLCGDNTVHEIWKCRQKWKVSL